MSVLSLQQADIFRILQGRYVKWLVAAVNLLLVVWIASRLAALTWSIMNPPDEAALLNTGSGPVALVGDPYAQLRRDLPGWHLMGRVDSQGTVVVQTSVDAPETRLKLVLHGVLASAVPGRARAIIADPKGDEEQYAIGDKLPGNAELSEVYPDRVILKRNGRYETLRMIEGAFINTGPARSIPRRRGAANNSRVRDIPLSLKQDPKNFLEVIRPMPHRDQNRKMIGYLLKPGKKKELFEQLGLMEDDVAVRINNVKLDSAANGIQVLRGIQSGDMTTLTILRNGQEQELNFVMPM